LRITRYTRFAFTRDLPLATRVRLMSAVRVGVTQKSELEDLVEKLL
jgi:hypothetical protein